MIRITTAKAELPVLEASCRGVLCNLLVCMALWMAMGGRSLTDKLLAVVLPVTGLVAAGFEHFVAHMCFRTLAALLGAPLGPGTWLHNLLPVIAGNIVGGSALEAGVYWAIQLRQPPGEPH